MQIFARNYEQAAFNIVKAVECTTDLKIDDEIKKKMEFDDMAGHDY